MALTADPTEYLAKLDKNLAVFENDEPATSTKVEKTGLVDVIPVEGGVAYVDNSQTTMMFFAFALVILILYLLERKKR